MKGIVLLWLITHSMVAVSAEPRFHLCTTYVEHVIQGQQAAHGWPVHLKLTATGTTHFQHFTERNLGHMSRVVVNDRVFLRATIEATATDHLVALFASKETASEWHQALTEELPTSPCGTGQP